MKSDERSVASLKITGSQADCRVNNGSDMLIFIERLGRLQTRMDELNDALKDYLERKRLHRRRKSANAELMRFSQQAKKLALYAPY
jgi:hypothetical protein